jgi:hypothetical protein
VAKKVGGTLKQVGGPPSDSRWVWLTADLIASAAWRGQSTHCRKLIDFLILEHLNHGGSENGNLAAPYNQLVSFGLGRRFIAEAIREADARRLIEVQRSGKRNQVLDHVSRYRLTWLPSKRRELSGNYYVAAEDEWKRTIKGHIDDYRAERTRRKKKKQTSGALGVNSISTPVVNSLGAPRVNLNGRKPTSRSVHHG